jgi:phosphatidate phosphatase APP1
MLLFEHQSLATYWSTGMADWYATLTKALSSVEAQVDHARFNFKLRHAWLKPIQIQPYRGHGTPNVLYLKGRVLEQKDVAGATESASDSVWENVLNMYRRFNSREIPGARLRVRFEDQTFDTQANDEGYFDIAIEPRSPLPLKQAWHEVKVQLLAPHGKHQDNIYCTGHVLVPPPQATFGVISDIDDTIVRTGAADPLAMARIVVLNNPHTRIPFEGVAAFYQALRKGGDGKGYNPIFYVSSSPWNLYDLLVDFMNINGIPLGPIFLRDVGLEPGRLVKNSHHDHKMAQIRRVLDTHVDLPFVLVGDSGQEDPEIYREVVRAYPGRIKGIYIRDVSLGERDDAVSLIITELHETGVEMVLAADTVAAAEHAVQQGLVTADALPRIRQNKIKDEQAPTIAEQIPGVSTLVTPTEPGAQA